MTGVSNVNERRFMTKSEVAGEHIRELIITGGAKAGDRLVTRDLAVDLHMSETPIREALRQLAAEGWVDLQSHQRAEVASFRSSQLEEIYALRAELGALAITLGGALITPEQLARADEVLEASAAAVEASDASRYSTLNRTFHVLISDTPVTEWTCRLLTNLTVQSSVAWRGFTNTPHRMEASLAEHRAIREAIGRGDFAAAATLHREHEAAAYRAVQHALQQQEVVEDDRPKEMRSP